jgi:hypothetical protein
LIEVHHLGKLFPGSLEDLEAFLDRAGFQFYKSVDVDNIYVAKNFVKK